MSEFESIGFMAWKARSDTQHLAKHTVQAPMQPHVYVYVRYLLSTASLTTSRFFKMPRNSASRPYLLPSSVHQTVFSSGPNQTSIIQGTQNMEIGQMNVDLTVTNVDNSRVYLLKGYIHSVV
jgi:hypothetical protein